MNNNIKEFVEFVNEGSNNGTPWKQIKDDGVFDNLPKGVLILFCDSRGYIDALIKETYTESKGLWYYSHSDTEIPSIKGQKYVKYFIPRP